MASASPLNCVRIEQALSQQGLTCECHASLDSTNNALARERHRHRHLVLAEQQTAGRGRRGRRWIAPVRSGLCMSFGFRFGRPIDQLGPLSLAIGVAVVEALRKQAGPGLGLKWPNDLMHQGDKLGGLLIEAQPDRSNGTRAVIGLGLNVNLPDHVHRTEPAVNDRLEGRGWTDLRSVNDRDWSRTELAIDLALAVDRACERYLELGFAPFYQRWASVDALVGQWVTAESVSQDPIEGFARGVNDLGELLIETESGWVSMSAGEVSVRFRTQAENDLRQ